MKNFIIMALIVGACIIIGCKLIPAPVIQYGASPGPDHYQTQYFLAGLVEGGEVNALDGVSTTETITGAEFCDSKVLTHALIGDSATTTLPSTSTLTALCLHTDGLSHSVLYRNTAAATASYIVAGSGIDLLEPDGQNVVIGGGADALITCWRQSNTAVACLVDEFIDAD